MNDPTMEEIIDAYTDALIDTRHIVGRESELPYPKAAIAEVLLDAYQNVANDEERGVLEEAYLKLESFLPDKDFEIVSQYLQILGELKDSNESLDELFKKAVEKVPTTAVEVQEIFARIEKNLQARKNDLKDD